jgi:hypothetical protein
MLRYSEIFTKFLALFPNYADEITHWAPATVNTIRIKRSDGSGLIFTYINDLCWTLECGAGYHSRKG